MLTPHQIKLDKKKIQVFDSFNKLRNLKKTEAIKDTAMDFGVSEMTVRNYLSEVKNNRDYFDNLR